MEGCDRLRYLNWSKRPDKQALIDIPNVSAVFIWLFLIDFEFFCADLIVSQTHLTFEFLMKFEQLSQKLPRYLTILVSLY